MTLMVTIKKQKPISGGWHFSLESHYGVSSEFNIGKSIFQVKKERTNLSQNILNKTNCAD